MNEVAALRPDSRPPPPTVLIVDDEAPMRAYLRSALEEVGGYRVVEAENGALGVALAQRVLPDLILMDINMPVLDGILACEAIRADARTNAIPVFLVTAYSDGDTRLLGQLAGATRYLTKPISPTKLLEHASSVLPPPSPAN